MATAKQEGGLYYKPIGTTGKYIAVDADGNEIKDAPKRPKDTEPGQQPAGGGMLTLEERIAVAVATASKNPDAVLKSAGAFQGAKTVGESTSASDGGEEQDLPTVADLPDHLQTLTSADDVRKLQATDDRTTAQKHYEARLAELEGKS